MLLSNALLTRAKVTHNFRITIPDEVRRRVKLKVGETVDIEAIDSQHVLVKRLIPLEELEGAWKDEPGVDQAMKVVTDLWKS